MGTTSSLEKEEQSLRLMGLHGIVLILRSLLTNIGYLTTTQGAYRERRRRLPWNFGP